MLSEKFRSSIFHGLSPLVGEEAIGEMLAPYPATPDEQPVGKGHLDAQLADLVVEMHQQPNSS